MKPFMGEDFLLEGDMAKTLYHNIAAKMPIVDYHCHISPKEIYENKAFENITEAWLAGDHYKWRQMRVLGLEESIITGAASPKEKFFAFAAMMPMAAGNPIYHWAHLELKRYFSCNLPLCEENAEAIWTLCNEKLRQDPGLRVRGIIERSQVTTVVTTDDPVDTLEWHEKLREDSSFKTKVLPAFRPDKAINIHKDGFVDYIKRLGLAAGVTIASFASLTKALRARIEFFHSMGCRASDHGIDEVPPDALASEEQLDNTLAQGLAGIALSREAVEAFQFAVLHFLGTEYHRKGWVMELHFGAQRNVNSSGFSLLGPDTGYDCIRPQNSMLGLAALLNSLNNEGTLPKTLIFSLNPNDNEAINTLCGCFGIAGTRGGVQQGAAWWFNDTLDGIRTQLTTFACQGLMGTFLGMLTDSRSFLSYTRHEYFRRIFCNLLGGWVDRGEYPDDMDGLKKLVEDVSYNNAMAYFGY